MTPRGHGSVSPGGPRACSPPPSAAHQREQGSGGEEGLSEHDPVRGLAQKGEGVELEQGQPEQREHDRRLTGHHLDGRLGDAGERRRPAELAQPHRHRDANRHRNRHRHRADDERAEHRVQEAAGLALAHPWRRVGEQQAGTQVADSFDSEVDDDRARDRTEQQAEQPGQAEPEAVGQPVRAARAGSGRTPAAAAGAALTRSPRSGASAAWRSSRSARASRTRTTAPPRSRKAWPSSAVS